MSRIATARQLAARFIALVGKMDAQATARLRNEVPLAFSLAQVIDLGMATQVTDDALCVLENGVKNAEMSGPIFEQGSYVMAFNHNSDEAPQRYLVKGVIFDGQAECYLYNMEDSEGLTFLIMEGDLDWDVQPA